MNLNNKSFGIVCPMANEKDSAERFVSEVLMVCRPFGFLKLTMFVVFDNKCTDGTIDLLRNKVENTPELKVVFAPENRCVVDAYIRGYREAIAAKCDWVLEIDAGFSHQPADIPQFIRKMSEGYDCVFGSRFCRGGHISDNSVKRTLLSKGGTILSNFLLGTKLKDMTSGFEMFTRPTLENVLKRGIQSRGPFFQTEIKSYVSSYRCIEVPIHYRAASHNISNSSINDALENLLRLFRLRLRNQLALAR
jgi:dolichol-phosphate mannosyltransferase